MLLSEKLRKRAEETIEKTYEDPYIQGLIKADIPLESVRHYLRADSLYLEEFARIYGMIIARARHKSDMIHFYNMMEMLMGEETDAHATLAKAVGEPYEQIIKDGEWYPSADHYIKHMHYNVLARENIAFAVSAMAPCPYVYRIIAKKAIERNNFPDDHPYLAWFEFYNNDMEGILDVMFNILDEEAKKLSEKDIKQLEQNFLQSVEHERRFFHMAYSQEHWPIS